MWSKEEHLQLSVLVFATGVDPALFTVATSPALNPTRYKSRGMSTKPSVHFHMLHSCRCKFSISQVWHPCKAPLLFLPTYAHRAQQPPVRHRSISRWPLLNRSKGKSHLQLNFFLKSSSSVMQRQAWSILLESLSLISPDCFMETFIISVTLQSEVE